MLLQKERRHLLYPDCSTLSDRALLLRETSLTKLNFGQIWRIPGTVGRLADLDQRDCCELEEPPVLSGKMHSNPFRRCTRVAHSRVAFVQRFKTQRGRSRRDL